MPSNPDAASMVIDAKFSPRNEGVPATDPTITDIKSRLESRDQQTREQAAREYAKLTLQVAQSPAHPEHNLELTRRGVNPTWITPPPDQRQYFRGAGNYDSPTAASVFRENFPKLMEQGPDIADIIKGPEHTKGSSVSQDMFDKAKLTAQTAQSYVTSAAFQLDEPIIDNVPVIDTLAKTITELNKHLAGGLQSWIEDERQHRP
jgi:hypothetical protein